MLKRRLSIYKSELRLQFQLGRRRAGDLELQRLLELTRWPGMAYSLGLCVWCVCGSQSACSAALPCVASESGRKRKGGERAGGRMDEPSPSRGGACQAAHTPRGVRELTGRPLTWRLLTRWSGFETSAVAASAANHNAISGGWTTAVVAAAQAQAHERPARSSATGSRSRSQG